MTTGHQDGVPSGAEAAETVPAGTGSDVPTIESLSAELEAARAQHLRAVADYQNLRRRSEEERKEYARYTMTALIVNYLPVLDDLERALASVDADIAGREWVEGIRLVERKFRGVLEGAGVKPVEVVDQPFDPAKHEAISYAPGPEGVVVAVAQPGYEIDGKVIRPARVVVGNGQMPAS